MERRNFIKMTGLVAAGSVLSKEINAMVTTNEKVVMTMRIHHFFDIIRDLRTGEKITADTNYKHSYHSVANTLRDNPSVKMKIIVGLDSVCDGCIHNEDGKCDDPLTIKKGFTMKHDYNNYLDKRILEKLNWSEGDIVTPKKICKSADKYINAIYQIYEIDLKEEIDARKKEFIEGLQFYSDHNNLKLKYLSNYNL
jgi:hypothetical protein